MSRTLAALGLAVCTVVGAAAAESQQAGPLRQPAAFQPAAYALADQAAPVPSTSPSDQPPPPPPPALSPATPPITEPLEAASPSAVGEGSIPYASAPAGPKPFALPQPNFFKEHGIVWGGWLQQGITFNGQSPPDRFNGPLATNDRDSEYQLNQFWLYFLRPTNTDGCGWDLGGRIDMIYGTDWRYGQCEGLENRIDDPNSFYGLVLPQFYLEVAVNDLTVKLGHFATLTSYEVVPSPLNFFYSHSYLMAGYFDPLLVTGAQAEYKLDDHWTAIGGFNRGWQMFEDPSDTVNFLGGVKWTGEEKRTTFGGMVDTGPQIGFTGVHDRTSVIMVLTHAFTERLAYASQYDVGTEANGSTVNPGEDAHWFGMEQLFTYKLNPKWSAGVRYEWVRDEDGARIAGIGNLLGTPRGWSGAPGFIGSFHDLTLGLNYRPHPSIVFRPEVRWDWYDGPRNVANQLPFDTFARSHQFTTAMDLLVTF